MNNRFRIEEYFPGGSFLKKSFATDRAELAVRFPEFTAAYETLFINKLKEVKVLEQSVKLTEEEKDATNALYTAADALDKELNFLSFYFKQAGLDSGIISAVKKDLSNSNIEGACDKLEGVIQYITDKQPVLEPKGMGAGFPAELAAKRDFLNEKNELQNEKENALNTLYAANKGVYKALLKYIMTICEAGKIMYKGTVKADEYTVSKLISRMRSGNEGGGGTPPTP